MIIKHKIDAFYMPFFPKQKGWEKLNWKHILVVITVALSYLKKQSSEQVKKTAFEFAAAGETGIKMEKEDYSIQLIANKIFNGKQFLSWLYVSWAIGIPEHLEKRGLKFEREFEVAKSVGGK